MTSDRGHDLVRRSWTLLLGPGASLAECVPLLRTLADASPRSAPADIEPLEDWSALFCDFSNEGRIVADASTIRLEHLGLLRGFLERRGGWELDLVGERGEAGLLRELLALPRSRWAPGGLDVAWMKAVLRPLGPAEPSDASGAGAAAPVAPSASASGAGAPVPAPARTRDSAPPAAPPGTPAAEDTDDDALLEQVERILRGEASAPAGAPAPTAAPVAAPPAAHAKAAPAATASRSKLEVVLPPEARAAALPELDDLDLEFDPFAEPEPQSREAPRADAGGESPAAGPASPAPYFRHQVADLADLVQCVDLGLGLASEELEDQGGTGSPRLAERLQEVASEVARLRQFTNTLSFLVAPPGTGTQRFDLAPLLEEMLTARRGEPEAPRYLIRTPEPLEVRSDKMLLSQAFDAFLFLAHHAAGAGGTVRVDGRLDEDDEEVRVSIRFPAGRFAGRPPGRLLEPYGLRRDLPELGANALAAASGLVRGQGGRVELRAESGDGLEWLVHLPAVD